MMAHGYSRKYLLGALCLLGLLRPAIGKLNCGTCEGDLKEHSSVYVTFKCDVCNNIMWKKDGVPSIMHGCRKCDYDACADCYSKHSVTGSDTNSSTSDMSVSVGSVNPDLAKRYEDIMNRAMYSKLQWAKTYVDTELCGKTVADNPLTFTLAKVSNKLKLIASLEEHTYEVVMDTVTDYYTLMSSGRTRKIGLKNESESSRWNLYTVLRIAREASLVYKNTRNYMEIIAERLNKKYEFFLTESGKSVGAEIVRWEVDSEGKPSVVLADKEGTITRSKQFGLKGDDEKQFDISVEGYADMPFRASENNDDGQLFLMAQQIANPNTGKFRYEYISESFKKIQMS